MKQIVALLALVTTLTGCAAIEYFNMARFDNNEYLLAVKVRTQANLGARKCGTNEVNAEVSKLWEDSLALTNYAEAIPNNEETIKMSTELLEIVRGLDKRYNVDKQETSLAYCTTKFANIEKNATIITNVVGKKPR